MANVCKCQHKDCTAVTTNPVDERWISVPLKNRGNRFGYLCPLHSNGYGDSDYSDENDTLRGKMKKNGYTYSFEFEVRRPSVVFRAELLNAEFLPTRDITTECEFKSPIYLGLNAIPKKLQTIESLLNNGHGAVTDGDGTHFHVGHVDYINHETMRYISRFYHSLFVPLSDAMRENPELTEKLFGRNFVHYAQAVNENTRPYAHENFINIQHDNTIEFRLCKFRNSAQYMNAVHFCKAATDAIINNFIKHFDDPNATTATRKHKADIAAQKLVRLFYKYANNTPE